VKKELSSPAGGNFFTDDGSKTAIQWKKQHFGGPVTDALADILPLYFEEPESEKQDCHAADVHVFQR
jgi:hypothetical protein